MLYIPFLTFTPHLNKNSPDFSSLSSCTVDDQATTSVDSSLSFPIADFVDSMILNKSGTCKSCLTNSLTKLLSCASDKLDKMCTSESSQRCPFIHKVCEIKDQYNEVVSGAVISFAHLPQTAFAYCLGKSECSMDDLPKMGEEEEEDGDIGVVKRSLQANVEDEVIDSDIEKCMEKNIYKLIKRVIKKVKDKCAKTTCEWFKRFCEFSDSHEQSGLGLLIGKVEPWKYAAGKCNL
jgi:hypothetical protein